MLCGCPVPQRCREGDWRQALDLPPQPLVPSNPTTAMGCPGHVPWKTGLAAAAAASGLRLMQQRIKPTLRLPPPLLSSWELPPKVASPEVPLSAAQGAFLPAADREPPPLRSRCRLVSPHCRRWQSRWKSQSTSKHNLRIPAFVGKYPSSKRTKLTFRIIYSPQQDLASALHPECRACLLSHLRDQAYSD